METHNGGHICTMQMQEGMELKKLLFLNILIPSLLKSNNILVKKS